METVHIERIISHTAFIVKRAGRDPRSRYHRDADKISSPNTCDWFDILVHAWEAIFHRAKAPSSLPARTKFVAEALESKIISMLEDWSLHALDAHLCEFYLLYVIP